ncbi:MAG: hypothetical protein HYZ26_00520 [Chloroflexi bacterium]|nr:hypothetical protein [Chloroflexota bacterium]
MPKHHRHFLYMLMFALTCTACSVIAPDVRKIPTPNPIPSSPILQVCFEVFEDIYSDGEKNTNERNLAGVEVVIRQGMDLSTASINYLTRPGEAPTCVEVSQPADYQVELVKTPELLPQSDESVLLSVTTGTTAIARFAVHKNSFRNFYLPPCIQEDCPPYSRAYPSPPLIGEGFADNLEFTFLPPHQVFTGGFGVSGCDAFYQPDANSPSISLHPWGNQLDQRFVLLCVHGLSLGDEPIGMDLFLIDPLDNRYYQPLGYMDGVIRAEQAGEYVQIGESRDNFGLLLYFGADTPVGQWRVTYFEWGVLQAIYEFSPMEVGGGQAKLLVQAQPGPNDPFKITETIRQDFSDGDTIYFYGNNLASNARVILALYRADFEEDQWQFYAPAYATELVTDAEGHFVSTFRVGPSIEAGEYRAVVILFEGTSPEMLLMPIQIQRDP